MKKVFIFLLTMVMMVSIVGCGGSERAVTQKKQPVHTESAPVTEPIEQQATGNRLESYTIYSSYSDTTETYTACWDETGCTFTMTENGDLPCLTLASFDPETGAFSVHRMPEQTDGDDLTDVTMCIFDEQGRVKALSGIPFAINTDIPVEYEASGWPTMETLSNLGIQADPEQMQFFRALGNMASPDFSVTTYFVGTLGLNGQVVKVDRLEKRTYQDGTKEEKLEENVQTFVYDTEGNLMKFSYSGGYVEFTYSDQPIGHNWERLIPLLCFDFSYVFLLPLFWNV